jgi:F-type H+-transporting ATPase subunit delta
MIHHLVRLRPCAVKFVARRFLATEAAGAKSGLMTLNFNLPHESIYKEVQVSQVIIPGAAGEYGVTADHVPVVAQMKAGVLQIIHEGSSEPEKYFVPGGFSITHPNSITVSCFKVESLIETQIYGSNQMILGYQLPRSF